jgi:hypothetical protein
MKNMKKKTGKMNPTAAIAALAAAMKRTGVGQNKKKKSKKSPSKKRGSPSRAVASVCTAPVAIGNSVRGSESRVSRTSNGAVLTGRDFMFTPIGTGSVQTWCLTGGSPLSPAAFADSNIRQYLQMYQKYRWRACAVHYITSSPTSSTGDVMFYHAKNRDSVFLNQTSSMLLPFVISDPSSVIGPQWTNHSTQLQVTGTWKSTDYGMADSPNDYSDGEVFLLSKTTTTDSPGYVLFDYVIEFADQQLSPRLLTLPLPRIQWWNMAVNCNSAKTQGNAATFAVGGNNLSGVQSAFPSTAKTGDIFKVIFDITNSTFTTGTAANLLQGELCGNAQALTLSDGFTCYALMATNGFIAIYSNASAAYNANAADSFAFGATLTYNVNVQIWISLIGTLSTDSLVPNF